MSSHSHYNLYQYESKGKACWYCRWKFAKISKYKIKFWDDHRVCDSCYTQLSHGVKLTQAQWLVKSYSPDTQPRLCKLCNKNEIYKVNIINKKNTYIANLNKYPHFCEDCAIKFKQMVKDNPRDTQV